MKTIKKIGLVSAVAFAMFALSACDDSSSASSDETGVSSSSVESPDSSVTLSGASAESNGSSNENMEKDKSSSSKKTTSSSSALSTDSKNSSSSGKSGSSSSQTYRRCQEGMLDTLYEETRTLYKHCENDMWRTDSIVKIVIEQPKVYPNMDSVFGSEFKAYGTYEDLRDNNVYKTTKYYEKFQQNGGTVIDSFTVMAQNLNYAEIMIDSTTTVFDDSKVEKRCYKDDPWYCDNYFGARYTWSEAMGLPKVCDSVGVADNPKCNIDLSKKVQGVCPTGWHVMTETEWKHFAYTNGLNMTYSLLSHAVWEKKSGNNPYGMSVLPEGDEYPYNKGASFWIPYEKSESNGGVVDLAIDYFTVSSARKYGFMSIRCVQDEGDTFLR
ncbi:FISUMP domain-containing protein [Fibrobacter sp. UWB10]|uniref:FISUMP domain-containing protein n=1 Tax=Fibrobacter sp. UWB10 TaxID=1896201 RepID=UPI002403778F|nr:FISUMP domain-containing protein [Fibrobacter sp. UWB10]SMP52270.1 major paralogous domain-containing protein [Fibrobacter sp. UWB10]